MSVILVTEETKYFYSLLFLAQSDEYGLVTDDFSIEIKTQREDLNKCSFKQAIMAGVDYICSIRKAMREQEFTEEEILFLEKEIGKTKQDINKCL